MAAVGGFEFKWSVGLINCSNKYLTAEQFQFKVTANGNSLRKKQTWLLEQVSESNIAIKSCYGRYLGSDKNGIITADSESIEDDNKFELITQDTGKVAIKTVHGRFFGGSGDNLTGFDKDVGPTSLWTIQLAIMPQMNLRNVNRKTYAHLDGEEIRVNEEIPWGFDATISLDFHDGKYSIRAADGRYLSRNGPLQEVLDDSCLFLLVFKGTHVAFRDNQGKYLAAVGANATLQSRKTTIGKDELFTFEDTNPQVTLIASNGKYLSIRQGIDVRGNQTEKSDTEIFQLVAIDRDDMSGNVKWALRAKNKKYWNSENNLVATAEDFSSPTCQFSIEWEGPMVLFKASNGKYISIKSGGQLAATAVERESNAKFVLELINHPIITLRCEHGYVGSKTGSAVLECNRSQYDVFRLHCNAGTYNIQCGNGKFWNPSGDTIRCDGETAVDIFVEFRAHTRMCIITPNGQYIKGSGNGFFSPNGGDQVNKDTLWEY